jgi:uncharacterized protein YjdB
MSARAASSRVAGAVLGALLALSCARGGGEPSVLGQLRVLPAFAAQEDPQAFGVEVETIRVTVRRGSASGSVVVDTTLGFEQGRTLAWLLDLVDDPDDLAVDLVLAGHGAVLYSGNRGVSVPAAIGAAAPLHEVMVRYVGPVLESIEVTPQLAFLHQPGHSTTFQAQARDGNGTALSGFNMSWSSSDPAVATIDAQSGVATAVGPGIATISAASAGKAGSATLRVTRVFRVTLLPDSTGLAAFGATQTYSATARDEDGQVVPDAVISFGSADPAVVTVDPSSGLATAVGNGVATITAQADGVFGTGRLDVRQRAVSVTVSPSPAGLFALGATLSFGAEARDANGYLISDPGLSWTSSVPGVATVDAASGLATSAGTGTTLIRATAGAITGSAALEVTQVIASIAVSPGASSLSTLGGTQQFTAVARDANGHVIPGARFGWSSTAPLVASVDPATGVATAIADGSASISAQAGGVTASATLTVSLTASALTVSPRLSTLTAIDATQQFFAVVRDASGNPIPGGTFVWSSGAPGIATVDANGLATGISPGITTITAQGGGLSGSATLEVTPTVATIAVAPGSATLTALGATHLFSAVARDANGHVISGVQFAWSSAVPGVATIAASGAATAAGAGTTTIRAGAGGVLGAAALTVRQVVAAIDVTPASASLAWPGPGQQFSATARDANGHSIPGIPFTWSSSAPLVASVDPASGLVTPLSAGGGIVSATSGGVSGNAAVQVNSTARSISVSPAQASITAGSAQQFTATVLDANGVPVLGAVVVWGSSDQSVATIDPATGRATGSGSGNTTITATAGGLQGSAQLSVRQVASVVVTAAGNPLIQPGATIQLTATAFDASGSPIPGVTFLWSSSAPGIASVDPVSGLVSGVAAGTVVITATAPGGAKGQKEVRVQ